MKDFNSIFLLWISLFLCVTISFSEEVCSFRYTEVPEPLNGKTLTIHSKTVAMDKFITVGDSSSNSTGNGVASVFFIIDNSQSMYNMMGTDIPGERFEVPNALIDSFYKANPDIEVGCAIFQKELVFDPASDDIIQGLTTDSYGYLPLMKLGDSYNSSTLGNKKGYDILKHFLDYEVSTTVVGPMGVLTYKNTAVDPKGTNINSGFNAAKDAFKSATYPKGKQFIIFISDGLQEGGTDDYLLGKNTPTTFTIYMAKSASFPPPQKLRDMTANIQNNGYSTTNPKSVIKLIKTGTDGVLAWTLANVVDVIFDVYNYVPQQMKANTILNTQWDKGGFTFQKLFPLLAKSTDFTYEIDYDFFHNDVKKGDTTHVVHFEAETATGSLSDKIEYTFWGRNLEFRNGGTKITAVTSEMDNLEIRFAPYEVDTLYGYQDVTVELTTSSGDLEELSLEDKSSYFSITLDREVGVSSKNDGTIQHGTDDEFTITFRNPDLPLDTVQITIPFEVGDDASIESATYFDKNADGKVDSISIVTRDCALAENFNAIVDVITLAPYRDFKIDKQGYSGDKLWLLVDEQRSAISTDVISADKVQTTKEITLKSGVLLPTSEVLVIDSIAPVVLRASLIDSVKVGSEDRLTVTFSEEIKAVKSDQPFRFYALPDLKEYDVTLSKESQSGAEATFLVTTVSGKGNILEGDSLNIRTENGESITDLIDKSQQNSSNRRCEIEVITIDDKISITGASYFDNNADGFVDSIYVKTPGIDLTPVLSTFVESLTLPAHRDLTIENYEVENGGVGLTLTEKSGTIRTFTTTEDRLIVESETTLGEGLILKSCDVTIRDSVAPVVMTASLVDSVKSGALDLLTVTFSEEIESVTDGKLLNFLSKLDNAPYEVELTKEEQNPTEVIFQVGTITGQSTIRDGDSLWINADFDPIIGDTKSNSQDNSNNLRREIQVTTIEEGIKLTGATYFDTNADGKIDSIFVELSGENREKSVHAIVENLELPYFRKLKITSYEYNKGIALRVTQSISKDEINTAVTSDDRIKITEEVNLDDEMVLLEGAVSVTDKMAPVIMRATALDSTVIQQKGGKQFISDSLSRRELTLTFSEEVQQILDEQPFYLYAGTDQYETLLSLKDVQDKRLTFIVTAVNGVDKINDGDSIHINWEEFENVGDTLNNWQENRNNIKRAINLTEKSVIKLAPADIEWKLKATILKQSAEDEIDQRMYVTLTPKNPENFTDNDSLEAYITLIDPVGNVIFTGREFLSQEPGIYLYTWDGTNKNSRSTGSGSFTALVEGYRHFTGEEEIREPIQFRTNVGVQE